MPKQVDSESHPVRRDSFTDIPLADSNGGIVLSIGLVAGLAAFIFLVTTHFPLIFVLPVGLPTVLILVAIVKGLVVVKPNESLVCLLFGRYVGTEHQPGLWWVNPFCERKKTSRRLFTLECGPLKVNDAVGNPVDIGAVIIWRVEDAARATLEVQSYKDYVEAQSEAALRRLASTHPYDDVELETVHGDGHPKRAISTITLRDGGDEIIAPLLRELQVRMSAVGVVVLEARISHLAYASEIAGAMLRKQAASAVLAARRMVVRGAVGIVADALQELESKHLSDGLDAERKAAMVSNLLVVLVGDRDVSPVINTGTLYS
jgi:regulator of protease activity HflC (stomatin/prohibitin superfamily)